MTRARCSGACGSSLTAGIVASTSPGSADRSSTSTRRSAARLACADSVVATFIASSGSELPLGMNRTVTFAFGSLDSASTTECIPAMAMRSLLCVAAPGSASLGAVNPNAIRVGTTAPRKFRGQEKRTKYRTASGVSST